MRGADLVLDIAAGVVLGGFLIMVFGGMIVAAHGERHKTKSFFGPALWRYMLGSIVLFWFVCWRMLYG